MRLRLGAALLALASAPLTGGQAGAAVAVARPAYLNIVVTSAANPDQPPRVEVQRLEVIEGDTTLSPRVECGQAFVPQKSFSVRCTAEREEPIVIGGGGNQVTVQGRYCTNAAVRAEINGLVANEAVTGSITCGDGPVMTGASCTASATTVHPTAGYTGMCFQPAPDGPLPIRCDVDLTRVRFDNWRITCYGTDP